MSFFLIFLEGLGFGDFEFDFWPVNRSLDDSFFLKALQDICAWEWVNEESDVA